MTEVSFHFNVPDRTVYTCRLVRKAHRTGATVVLAGPAPMLAHLDRALWTFEELEFLPHVLLRPGQPVEPRWQATRVWLAQDASQPGHHDVLVNLGADPPAGFESFGKLIEIVSADEDERTAARARWRHYSSRGYAIQKHEVAA